MIARKFCTHQAANFPLDSWVTKTHAYTYTQIAGYTHTHTYTCQLIHTFTMGYAPFLSMAVRESFLTVGESLAAAPGPGHNSPDITFKMSKGGGVERRGGK